MSAPMDRILAASLEHGRKCVLIERNTTVKLLNGLIINCEQQGLDGVPLATLRLLVDEIAKLPLPSDTP